MDVRINVRRALKALLATLVIPMTAAILLDLATGLLPLLTIAGVVICIPLATIVVNRTLLEEMNRVIELVAPALPPEVPPLETQDRIGNPAPGATS